MSSDSVVLSVHGVTKTYRVYSQPQDRLKQFVLGRWKKFFYEFEALKPVTFELKHGECIGIVGRNGSGKSTLLQILTGILTPTSGSYEVSGRTSALLELGAGFNMEYTGRENVFLNAAILGLTREEIQARFAQIEAFAEIGSFIDQPVKTYSSGMYIRLAFSVAIHVQPDLLVVDEALSVGDAAFQHKCMQKIRELRAKGMSILFVTHDTQAVKLLCDRAIWLHEGKQVASGSAADVVHRYEDFLRNLMKFSDATETALETSKEAVVSDESRGGQFAKLLNAEVLDARGGACHSFLSGGELRLRITYEVYRQLPDGIVLGAAIFRGDDLYVCGLNTRIDSFQPRSTPGIHQLSLVYKDFNLLAGSYYFKTGIFDSGATVKWDFDHSACEFTVDTPYIVEGVVMLKHEWTHA
jgi:teichoic acid transport system ATP-binding protein